MKKIGKFIDNNTAYILILPAVLFILLFSIIPIFESLRYAFYDFQLNDQAKSGLYTSGNYNMTLYDETFDYIRYFLDIEESVVTGDEAKAQIINLRQMLDTYDAYMLENVASTDMKSIVSLDGDSHKYVTDMKDTLILELEKLYGYDEPFYSKDDMFAVVSELETAIIQSNFSGLENFKDVVTDKRVRATITFTLIFTFVSVFLELCLGMMLALIMNKALMGRGLIRTISLIPWAIPTSVAALMWSYLYDGSSGIVAHTFASIGLISEPTQLLLSAKGALGAIILADVWKTTPYMALLLLAGLQVISNSLYESSSLDGATKLQQFRYITLPLLKPSIFVALLFRTLDAFRVFDLIYVLTGGGPGGTTESISLYAYKVMFAQTRFGYGSAMVLIMAIAVGLITLAYIKILNVKLIGD
ncbi:MAG TPA: sugar ABC transporter permease [Fusibacter sp.]|nr:sugar ABC transporter permease [Fusibacter sp.]